MEFTSFIKIDEREVTHALLRHLEPMRLASFMNAMILVSRYDVMIFTHVYACKKPFLTMLFDFNELERVGQS